MTHMSDLHDIENVFNRFIGKIEQVPPRYSAIKFKGKSLYKWTRKGIDYRTPTKNCGNITTS